MSEALFCSLSLLAAGRKGSVDKVVGSLPATFGKRGVGGCLEVTTQVRI